MTGSRREGPMHDAEAHPTNGDGRGASTPRTPDMLYRVLAESSPDIIFLASVDGRLLYINPAGVKQFGRSEVELRGRRLGELFPAPIAVRYVEALRYVVETGQSYLAESPEALYPSGMWIETRLMPVREGGGQLLYVMGIARDVSRRRRVEEALRASELRYRSFFEESPVALWEEDFSDVKRRLDALRDQGVADIGAHLDATPGLLRDLAAAVKVLDVNRAAVALYRARDKPHLLGDIARTFTEASLRAFRDELVTFAEGRCSFEAEVATRTLDGQDNMVALRVMVAPGYEPTLGRVLVSMHDLTEGRQAAERLQRIRELERTQHEREHDEAKIRAALQEKEVLLREIHHRVKNNLQIIASLLRLGSERVQDPQAKAIFRDSHGRIRSMALIHERLYRAGDLSRVPFREYVRSLTHELFGAHNAWSRGICLSMDVGEATLSLDVAIPCGLIIHELVNNALEHAFPLEGPGVAARGEGRIDVAFRQDEAGCYELRVDDNGVGLPPASELARRKSLGLELVETLVRQLGGTLQHEARPGCHVRITFAARPPR